MVRRKRQTRGSEADPPAAAAVSALSPRKRFVFIMMVMALPIAVLVLSEGLLRALEYGGYPPVLKEVGSLDGATLLTTYIPGAASYFDQAKGSPGSMGQYVFADPKPPNTVRVFLAGASAMQGYPQPVALASSAFLAEMLGDVWPDRNVEVINLGTTAVASFPVLGMLTEALEYEPDLVVIYSGHNEFFGAYGVASMQSGGRSPGAIRFHRWFGSLGLVQFIGHLTAGLASGDEAGNAALMERMVGQAKVGANDPLRDDAARNLQVHVGEMIRRCQERDVPVIVCTLASNERDLAPIGAPNIACLGAADQARLTRLLNEAAGQVNTEPATAVESLEQVLELFPDHAVAYYLLGQAALAQADEDEARRCFGKALDCDPMPWRAPSRSNDAIRAAASEHDAVLCDVQQIFRDASPHGCIGWELMDDHVHFSLEGQALLARCIVKTLTDFKGSLAVDRDVCSALPGWNVYAERLGDNQYERYAVAHGLRNVFDVPFMKASNPAAYARWDDICKRLFRSWPAQIQASAEEWQDPSLHHVVRRPLSGFVGRAMIRDKEFVSAGPLMDFAARCVPLFSTWNIEYVYFELLCHYQMSGELDEDDRSVATDAIERAEFMLGHGAGNPGLVRRFIGRLHQLRGEWAQSIPSLEEARKNLWEMELVACDAALIEAYLRTDQPQKARALAEDGIAHAGAFADYYRQFLGQIPPTPGP